MSKHVRMSDEIAKELGKTINKSKRYMCTDEEAERAYALKGSVSKTTKSREKQVTEKEFVLSAWNDEGYMMDIDQYCSHYQLPRADVKEYKLVSHTGTPYYNIRFKEVAESEVMNFDLEEIVKKHINPVDVDSVYVPIIKDENDFDTLTYTDVHIGMDTNPDNKAMYSEKWDRVHALASCDIMIKETINNQKSSTLIIDELGDFLDGYNQQTTRGGHALPQNMSNEEAFDTALEFKMRLIDGLAPYYTSIMINNICNDNHAGSFGYFVNKAFKDICSVKYPEVEVNNYNKFINHYYMDNTCFVITHGKDDTSLKFGFKPHLDTKGIEKIDQYLKQNDVYKHASKIVFKKGDSHQALFDMCSTDDFFYFNYPALSPSSMWVQNNFKKGRRGFVLESFKDSDIHELKPIFI
jgi:uncharacterized protein YmfQ (DUF2313 family)